MRLKHNELAPLSGLEKNRKYKIIWRIQKHIRKEKLHRNASLYFAKYEPYFKNLISIQNKGNILVFILIFIMRWFTLHLVLWIKCYVWKKIIPVHGNWSFFFFFRRFITIETFKTNYFKVKIILLSFRSMWFLNNRKMRFFKSLLSILHTDKLVILSVQLSSVCMIWLSTMYQGLCEVPGYDN